MTHIPLHHPRYSTPHLPTLREQLKQEAFLHYTMFAYAAMAASKRMIRLTDGVVPGFRAELVNAKLQAGGIVERVAGVPNRKQRRIAKAQIRTHWKNVRRNDSRMALGLAPQD